MSLGEKIRKYRKERGFTQKSLGKLVGISEAMVRQYELGLRNPKIDTLQKIAAVLNVPLIALDERFKGADSSLSEMIYITQDKIKQLESLKAQLENGELDFPEEHRKEKISELENQIATSWDYVQQLACLRVQTAREEYMDVDYVPEPIDGLFLVGDVNISPNVLLKYFYKLNHDGKAEAIKRVKELTFIFDYTDPSFDAPFD